MGGVQNSPGVEIPNLGSEGGRGGTEGQQPPLLSKTVRAWAGGASNSPPALAVRSLPEASGSAAARDPAARLLWRGRPEGDWR